MQENHEKKEAIKEITNCLFTATEALREALDTADLKEIALPLDHKARMEMYLVSLENIAQSMKKRIS